MYNITDMMEIIKAILSAIFSAEGLTILAIIVGPIAAVQVARIRDKANEERERKLQIFRVLFSTRGQPLSWDHVAALNRIDLEFNNQGEEKVVIDAWKEYLDHLGTRISDQERWNARCQELHVNLLHEMGRVVGYGFDRTHIKNSAYSPQLYGNTEDEQKQLRQLTLEVLKGERPIPVRDDTPQQNSPPPRE